ncbi:MAG: potassium transporter TrkG [Luteolibacter sp.]|nr:potassium transporter TrkG [Luteolibacter sp.]
MTEPSRQVSFCRLVLRPLLILCSAFCLLVLVGWTGGITRPLHWGTLLIGILFALERGWLFWKLKLRGRERLRLALHSGLALAVFIVSTVLLLLPLLGAGEWPLAAHAFILAAVLVSGITSMIHHQSRYTARAFHPGILLMGSFLTIIIIGGLLLKMPRCVVPGETCSWLDAFFTSTSAVCVTGLVVHNTAHYFSHTGQMVILLLIQIGGLGIMTLSFFAAVVLMEGLSLHDRLLLGRMMQDKRLARIGKTLSFIVGMTFVCEGIGAVILFLGMDGMPDLRTRVFHSVFHSVSAFCNAGFSTLPDGLADGAVGGNRLWQVVIMALIVIGGLGAFVNEDLSNWFLAKVRRWSGGNPLVPRLRVHTRLVLFVTALLILGGAAAIMATEFHLSDGPRNGGRILTAFFHSVTARTAGFNTVPMSQISALTMQILMVLMLIGGSPGGTAGGLRTTVVAVGLACLWNQLRTGKGGIVAFNRTIPRETGSEALGLIMLAALWLVPNFIVFQMIEAGSGVHGITLLFELISAFGTVGLSMDLTPTLSEGGRMLLIVNMFVGRVGLLTVLATFIRPDSRAASGKPSENIILT